MKFHLDLEDKVDRFPHPKGGVGQTQNVADPNRPCLDGPYLEVLASPFGVYHGFPNSSPLHYHPRFPLNWLQ